MIEEIKEVTVGRLLKTGLEEPMAERLAQGVNQLIKSLPAPACWQKISKEILHPNHPFELHELLFSTVFSDWDMRQGPPPAWIPSEGFIKTTNIAQLMEELIIGSYKELHAWSVQNGEEFWNILIKKLGIQFKQVYRKIVNLSSGVESPRWLVDAKLNIADSCFNAPHDAVAIIYQNVNGPISKITYREIETLTNRVSNGLFNFGFKRGDAIAISMPMTAESVAIYLGIIKAGCVVVSIADSFASPVIEERLRLANTKGIFTQDYIGHSGKQLPMYSKIVSANAPRAIVLPGSDSISINLRDGDVIWDKFLSDDTQFESISCPPYGHTNILFSSGTTGDPKTIPWTHTTPIKCAADGYLHHNIQPGDVVAWPTNLGWMMGPWLIYASLINQATIALYSDAPTSREFGQFVQDTKVTILGVVPSLVRTWRNTQCMKGLDWSTIKAYSSSGESSNAEDMLYLMSLSGYKPVIEYCGGTEIGGGYITGTMVQPASPATFTTPALGLNFVILDENGKIAENGEVFIIPPSIGLSTELLTQNHYKVYFENIPKGPNGEVLRRHGDQVERLPGGYFRVHGRVDDTMNLAGIKVSSAEIEQVLNSINGISETAAISFSHQCNGPSRLVIYAVLLPGTHAEREILKDTMQQAIKRYLNPLFKIHDVVVVDTLPRTASNKVMRRELRNKLESNK